MQLLTVMVVLAQEEESSSNVALVLPETAELIAGIIAFSIVFFFVWKWAWPTINKTLEQRQAAIKGQMEQAESTKVDAETLLADYKSQLSGAKAEGSNIIDEARGAAEQMKADLTAKAEQDADQIRSKARDEAAAEKSRALVDAAVPSWRDLS